MRQSRRQPYRQVGPYAAAHALVDATCAALVFSASASGLIPAALALSAVVGYNLLAFATQPLMGWFVNDAVSARRWAQVGGLLTAVAFLIAPIPGALWPAIGLAGLANAAFHVGGGVGTLLLEPRRCSVPGLFVAPGAAGLALGIWMGTSQTLPWLPAALLLVVVPFLRVLVDPGTVESHEPAPAAVLPALALLMLFGVVALRALIGSGVAMPWKAEPALLIALTTAVVGGKALGGLLADRFGRANVGIGALCVSVPFLAIASVSPAAGVAGMLLFNMTMPVTLVSMVELIPQRPGLGFGLTCLALVAGTLPVTVRVVSGLAGTMVAALTLVSAVLLWAALRRDGHRQSAVVVEARTEEV